MLAFWIAAAQLVAARAAATNRSVSWWFDVTARAFVAGVAEQGGRAIDVYRLLMDGESDWPFDDWWWSVFEDFVAGKI